VYRLYNQTETQLDPGIDDDVEKTRAEEEPTVDVDNEVEIQNKQSSFIKAVNKHIPWDDVEEEEQGNHSTNLFESRVYQEKSADLLIYEPTNYQDAILTKTHSSQKIVVGNNIDELQLEQQEQQLHVESSVAESLESDDDDSRRLEQQRDFKMEQQQQQALFNQQKRERMEKYNYLFPDSGIPFYGDGGEVQEQDEPPQQTQLNKEVATSDDEDQFDDALFSPWVDDDVVANDKFKKGDEEEILDDCLANFSHAEEEYYSKEAHHHEPMIIEEEPPTGNILSSY